MYTLPLGYKSAVDFYSSVCTFVDMCTLPLECASQPLTSTLVVKCTYQNTNRTQAAQQSFSSSRKGPNKLEELPIHREHQRQKNAQGQNLRHGVDSGGAEGVTKVISAEVREPNATRSNIIVENDDFKGTSFDVSNNDFAINVRVMNSWKPTHRRHASVGFLSPLPGVSPYLQSLPRSSACAGVRHPTALSRPSAWRLLSPP